MMFWALMMMALPAAALLQSHIPGVPFLGGVRWPVLCSVVLYYALNHRGSAGVVSGFAAGFLIDALSFVPLGFSALLFSAMALLAGHYRKLVIPEAMVTAAFFGGIASLIYAALLYFLLLRGGWQGTRPAMVVVRLAGCGVTGALTAPLVFLVLTRLHKALNLDDSEEDGLGNA